MSNEVFQVCGATVPPLCGRANALQTLQRGLTKPTPDHLQVVGPRFVGKTVLLNRLAELMRAGTSPYKAVLLWDLANQTPDSDESFFLGLRDHLADAIKSFNEEYAAHLMSAKERPYQDICEVIDALAQENIKVLMLWDGFDKPLANGKHTRNLWDQLKELASRPNVQLVTASRKPLHELIRSAETQTSNFWGIFDPNPVRLERLDEQDINLAISQVSQVKFEAGAQTEIVNWTGGFPPLFLTLLNAVDERMRGQSVNGSKVNEIAESLVGTLDGFVQSLWSDCPQSSRDVFHELMAKGQMLESECGHLDVPPLAEKGFVKKSGTKIQSSCRFLERYLTQHVEDVGSMARLFGTPDAFQQNIRPLLERRLSHLTSLDASLKRYISRGIEDLPEHADVCISNIRGIIDRALDLIWGAELGPSKVIPPDHLSSWQFNGERGPEQEWGGKLPSKRGHQVRLLHLITGTERSSPKAKYVSRATYALVNAAHGFGDFGQHIDGEIIGPTVAYAMMAVCLELAANLDAELNRTNASG